MSDFKAKMHHSLRSPSWNKGDLLLMEGKRCREGGGERERSEGKGGEGGEREKEKRGRKKRGVE